MKKKNCKKNCPPKLLLLSGNRKCGGIKKNIKILIKILIVSHIKIKLTHNSSLSLSEIQNSLANYLS